jgi:type II secretory pathway component GspD/PulD (secretin)
MKSSFFLALFFHGCFLCRQAVAQDLLPSQRPNPAGVSDVNQLLAAAKSSKQINDGYWIEKAPINEVFQFLAHEAGLQFFYNNELNDDEYNVTGHLRTDDPLAQMEELAVIFGLSLHQQQSTLTLMNEVQMAKLPMEVMSYQLKYLRGAPLIRDTITAGETGASSDGDGGSASADSAGGGTGGAVRSDFEKLKSIIRPMLTPQKGQIEFEEKTNTLLVTDNTIRLERIRKLLEQIDKAKPQIMINVRVLRITRSQGRQVGVDWSRSLGTNGVPITTQQSLNALFNLPDVNTVTRSGTTAAPVDSVSRINDIGSGLVFSDFQAQAILRALESANLATQEACPTIITEDNEQGIISIVDRYPIITSNITNTAAGQNVTDLVRYKIDLQDPNPAAEPEKSREIGVTLTVTPTVLPDGTVRMKLRPRVAKIVELVAGRGTNVFPRVSESTVEAVSRIPAGQSLFLGGFLDYSSNSGNNKVPLIGSIPLIGKLFSSNNKALDQVSLVFVITPQVYYASELTAMPDINRRVREFSGVQMQDMEMIDGQIFNGVSKNKKKDDGGKREANQNKHQKRSWLQRIFDKKEAARE